MGNVRKVSLRISREEFLELHRDTHRTPTKAERRLVWDRLAKKYLKSKGYLQPKSPPTWKWTLGGQSGTVVCHTISQVKAAFKKDFKLSQRCLVPKELKIEKVTT
jgi:hypothetical protein